MDEGGANPVASFVPHRRKAAMVLLVVTLVWGATFIWMKQALNALEVEIETFGTFPVVAFWSLFAFPLPWCLFSSPSQKRWQD